MKNAFLYLFIVSCIVGCEQKKPSTYEIQYARDRTDSAVLVNYNLSVDKNCSFYLEYDLFYRLYQTKNLDLVYDYYLQHKKLKQSQAKYKHFMALKYCFHHQSDTTKSYDVTSEKGNAFEKQEYKKEYVAPKMPYHQPVRGH
jgi:hypothetical protein